jgi:hypothetical protein
LKHPDDGVAQGQSVEAGRFDGLHASSELIVPSKVRHGLADEILAGGDSTIVLSTTAIIIGLLLIILLTRA